MYILVVHFYFIFRFEIVFCSLLSIGKMVVWIETHSALTTQHHKHMANLRVAMKNMQLPPILADRILRYNQFLFVSRDQIAFWSLFRNLSSTLDVELRLSLYHKLIMKSPLFQTASSQVVRRIVLALKEEICMPGDFIIRPGEMATEIYFIIKGNIEVLLAGSKKSVGQYNLTFF